MIPVMSFTIIWNYMHRKKKSFHCATISAVDIDFGSIIESVPLKQRE